MTQNFIFIDIDGPLLPAKMHMFEQNRTFLREFQAGTSNDIFDDYPPMFDPWGVRAHNLLAKHGHAKIVLVTNWRAWWKTDVLKDMFAAQGLEFEYADRPECIKRGLSSERCHDVSCHIQDYLPDNSRALVIDDDDGLKWLNSFMPVHGYTHDRQKDYYPQHKDTDVGYVEGKNIEWKWLDVDYRNGLSYQQFQIGAEFLGIDMEVLKEEEFGDGSFC